jgi:hypothetical protein
MAPVWYPAKRSVTVVVTEKAYGSDLVSCHKGCCLGGD